MSSIIGTIIKTHTRTHRPLYGVVHTYDCTLLSADCG